MWTPTARRNALIFLSTFNTFVALVSGASIYGTQSGLIEKEIRYAHKAFDEMIVPYHCYKHTDYYQTMELLTQWTHGRYQAKLQDDMNTIVVMKNLQNV